MKQESSVSFKDSFLISQLNNLSRNGFWDFLIVCSTISTHESDYLDTTQPYI